MKIIPMADVGKYKMRDLIRVIVETPPAGGNGLNFQEINRRCRILEALEAQESAVSLQLEDEDYNCLNGALERFPFGVASVELRDALKTIKDAKSPSKDEKAAKKGKEAA